MDLGCNEKKRYNLTTLDAKHNKIIEEFVEEYSNIAQYKTRLTTILKEIAELSKLLDIDDENSNEIDCTYQIAQIKIEELKTEYSNLEEKIKNIENNNNDLTYHIETLPILEQYYSNNDYNEENNAVTNVLDMFIDQNSKTKSTSTSNTNISNKADLFNSYMNIVDPKSAKIIKTDTNSDANICSKCNQEMIIYSGEGTCICQSCGKTELVVIDSERPNYKDAPIEIGYFAYKRINHFNEWLAQFQAKESTDIPQDVLNLILLEIKKERINNMALIDNKKMREFLKRLRLNKFYEHIPHIINRLNGRPPMVMSRELEENLRTMFKEIQAPFLKHCPKGRKNFLSYSYVLHKFVQLLGLDEFIPSFPLLKSREKLHNQDLIWQKICNDLNWEFIKSI